CWAGGGEGGGEKKKIFFFCCFPLTHPRPKSTRARESRETTTTTRATNTYTHTHTHTHIHTHTLRPLNWPGLILLKSLKKSSREQNPYPLHRCRGRSEEHTSALQ